MNRDGIIFIVILLVLGGAVWFFLGHESTGPRLDRGPVESPFGRRDGDDGGIRKTSREARPPQDARREIATIETPGEELPPVTSRDDFGRLQGAILVVVSGPDGLPLPGALALLYEHLPGPGFGAERGELLAEASTDVEGRLSFDGLDVDRAYDLSVRHPDHRRFRAGPLRITAGRALVQLVSLGPGLVLEGQVTAKANGIPVVGARVVAYDLGTGGADPEGEIEVRAETDTEGRYRLENLAAGPKRVSALAEGYGSVTRPWVPLGSPGAPTSIDFALCGGASISGQVLEPDGRPISGASVRARPVAGQEGDVATGYFPETLTDGAGRYRLDGLLEGHYFLRAECQGFAEGNFGKPGEPRMASMANAQAGDVGIDLYLGKGPVVRGRVIDGETGEPVKVFDLYSDGRKDPTRFEPGLRRRVRDSEGRFEYAVPVLGMQARFIWLHARAPGYAGGRVLVDFSRKQGGVGPLVTERDEVEIVMLRGGGLKGRIVDAQGRAITGCAVRARRLRDKETVPNAALLQFELPESYLLVGEGASGEDGDFVIDNLDAGRYRVEYEHPKFALAVHADEVVFSGEGRMDIGTTTLTEGGCVFGQVVDDDGNPAEGARVALVAVDARLGASFDRRTGLSGAFRFERVPVGAYRLTVIERNGLDTRSAFYQQLKQRLPEEVRVQVENGQEQSFVLGR